MKLLEKNIKDTHDFVVDKYVLTKLKNTNYKGKNEKLSYIKRSVHY